jgi:calcineurin-like phosphoesterase family protein
VANFIISDTHFFHGNIIDYCDRPFTCWEQMNTAMIERWNEVVSADDDVYHLGDFAMAGTNRICEVRHQLNGTIHLVLGNHDRSHNVMSRAGFSVMHYRYGEFVVAGIDGSMFLMSHRPRDLPTWYENDGQIRLCGHVHNNSPKFIESVEEKDKTQRHVKALNVSCEYWDYKPTPVEQVVEEYKKHVK